MNVAFYFFLVARYIRIKQEFKLNKITKLMKVLTTNARQRKPNNPAIIWPKFCKINQKILFFFDQLRGFNHFWNTYLTNYFLSYIIMICYMGYAFLFGRADGYWRKSFYIFFSIEFFLMILLITYECSIIVYNNVQIYKTNRAFCYTFGKVAKPNPVYLLKVWSS